MIDGAARIRTSRGSCGFAVLLRVLALTGTVLAAAAAARCGSRSGPTAPPAGNTATIFAVLPDAVTLIAGDRGWVGALAAVRLEDGGQDVTAATTWESLNPSVVSVQSNILTALSPGQTEVVGRYQRLTGSVRVTVLPPSAIRQFSMAPTLLCWPGETFSWTTQTVVDGGAVVLPTAIGWRSRDERMVSVTPFEQHVGSGHIRTDAEVACRSAGTTAFEATYAGRTAVTAVTVRVPQDLIEIRGISVRQSGATLTHQVTAFYIVDSAAGATIRFESRDASDHARVLGSSSLAVARGSGTATLQNTVQGSGSIVCEVVDLLIAGGPAIRAAGSCQP
jgi:hypothetical protein